MSAPVANGEEKKRTHDDYTIGWVVILECELNAARLLLDEEHEGLGQSLTDPNTYLLGRIGEHNVVLASTGVAGTNAAANMVTNMFRTFRNIRFGLLVGVGGGAPRAPNREDAAADIRLGDVVVSSPKGRHGGVIQYDMGKWKDPEEFSIESHLNKPPGMLLSAVPFLQSDQSTGRGKMNEYIHQVVSKASGLPKLRKAYQFHGWGNDKLFKANYSHTAGHDDCAGCDGSMAEERLARESDEPAVHYGLIASANAVMRSATLRDKLRDVWGVSCFEMEAAGLMDSFPCLVIRGICDYSDSHKNKIWQPYAAIAAAAYAKDLLRIIKAADVKTVPPAVDTVVPSPPAGQHGEATDGGVHKATRCKVGHATLPAIDKILASPQREAFIEDLLRVGRVIISESSVNQAALEGFTHRWDINFRWWGSGNLYYNGMSQDAGRAKWMDTSAPLAERFRGWEAEIGCWLNGKWWMTYYDVARFMADLLEYVGVKDV
ncbi:hypothetical protein FQN53_007293 [Emmonsiellopsis sp. PD_33]|nr:hypothetical protein FQN53_007293 [Emmonsiellopsis sp. PD_33]